MAKWWGNVLNFFAGSWCLRAQSKSDATRQITLLQLPSRPSQAHRTVCRGYASSALGAASALLVIGRCSLLVRVLLHHALLGTMLSQRSLARLSVHSKYMMMLMMMKSNLFEFYRILCIFFC